ncbi:chloramphenicol-sensitive protein RarD [Collimonas sp. OK307]|uniref:EamA family transporter n=1 Tax=Collimonas sp. OK307 TaxID=1801620 RepID=UPI0008EF7EA7|nr:EamA family transporter [Collimonas sp. OK307]SFI19267.1 chloramphenicol-sensitive protein RarD [Collimonas sp. OK307]
MANGTSGNTSAASIIAAAIAGIAANVILGASSLFWRALSAIPSETLLGYRIVVSLGTLILAIIAHGKYKKLTTIISPKIISHHAIAALLVAINWGVFIWASINGHVLESGIGYLIAPFVAIAVGTLAFGERMSNIRRFAIAVIVVGVLLLLFRSGELNPMVYLVIGVTWGGYAYFKKTTPLDPFSGLFIETIVLSLIVCLLIPLSSLSFQLPHSLPATTILLLTVSGLVSILPLWMFSFAAKKLALSSMGFFQFILPITQLVVALVFYHQHLSGNTLICFSLIFAALLLIVGESFLRNDQLGKLKFRWSRKK